MKNYWITAALLSCALVVGCGDRGPESAPAPEAAPAAEAPPAEPAPAPEAPAAAPAPAPAPAPRATAGERPAAPRPAARPAPAPEAIPRAAAPAEPPRPTFREVSVPANTALSLELTTALSSETATVETPVTARLRQAVSIDGATVLPAGTVLRGNVTDVERPGRVKGRARLVFRFTEATVDGQRETIRTNPISFEGEATRGEDATKVGAGAGIGAVIGGIVGGGSGAAKGAAIGGAAGTGAVLATRGRDVELAPGTEISTTLAIPFQTQIPAR